MKNAVALVTGGSAGIGLAIARNAGGHRGAKVAITGRDEKRLAAARAVPAPIHADVAKEADVLRSYQELFQISIILTFW